MVLTQTIIDHGEYLFWRSDLLGAQVAMILPVLNKE